MVGVVVVVVGVGVVVVGVVVVVVVVDVAVDDVVGAGNDVTTEFGPLRERLSGSLVG